MNPYAPYVDDSLYDAAWRDADRVADEALAIEHSAIEHSAGDSGQALREMVALYGERGLLRHVTTSDYGGAAEKLSVRALCLIRERLAHASPLCELAFAMQGLGSYPMTHAGTGAGNGVAKRVLADVVAGRSVAAFALTETEAGSDLSRIATRATRDGDDFVLSGEKVFITNAAVADVYVVFAKTGADDAPASRQLSAFCVPADAPGVSCEPWRVLGGHPIGALRLDGVRLPADHLVGEEGRGLGVALATLGRFRTTVGAAAVGFAQRALDETVAHVKSRHQFGGPLADLAQVQARIGDMACGVESSRLLVYRSAWALDNDAPRAETSRVGSMAKLMATESAQQVIDSAVQLHGGKGVLSDSIVARLYEEVRALRIYEGTSDVQRVLIARGVLGE